MVPNVDVEEDDPLLGFFFWPKKLGPKLAKDPVLLLIVGVVGGVDGGMVHNFISFSSPESSRMHGKTEECLLPLVFLGL
jgi:hypothetical protein